MRCPRIEMQEQCSMHVGWEVNWWLTVSCCCRQCDVITRSNWQMVTGAARMISFNYTCLCIIKCSSLVDATGHLSVNINAPTRPPRHVFRLTSVSMTTAWSRYRLYFILFDITTNRDHVTYHFTDMHVMYHESMTCRLFISTYHRLVVITSLW